MLSRREFLRNSAAGAAAAAMAPTATGAALRAQQSPDEVAVIEPFWREVRASFALDPKLINLDNSSGSPSPRTVQESLKRHLDEVNRLPAHYGPLIGLRMDDVRRELATEFGCDPAELSTTAGAVIALGVAQSALDLQAGDEVVTTEHDHPDVLSAWDELARRGGIVVKRVTFSPPAGAADLLQRFEAALTPRTRILQFSHITRSTGQLLPVRDLSRLARSRGILTIVDGTQALGHLPFRLRGNDSFERCGHACKGA